MKAIILAEPIFASAMHTEPDHLKDVVACMLYMSGNPVIF